MTRRTMLPSRSTCAPGDRVSQRSVWCHTDRAPCRVEDGARAAYELEAQEAGRPRSLLRCTRTLAVRHRDRNPGVTRTVCELAVTSTAPSSVVTLSLPSPTSTWNAVPRTAATIPGVVTS